MLNIAKSLRAKLFVSVGVILLIVAFLSLFLPEWLVRQDLKRASSYLQERFQNTQARIHDAAQFLLSYHLLQCEANLVGVEGWIQNLSEPEKLAKTPYVFAATIASYSPQIDFVQVRDKNKKTVGVISEDAYLYKSQILPFQHDMIWVSLPEEKSVYLGIQSENGFYLLFSKERAAEIVEQNSQEIKEKLSQALKVWEEAKTSDFPPLVPSKQDNLVQAPIMKLYQTLLFEESRWIEKMVLTKKLSFFVGDPHAPSGMLQMSSDQFGFGYSILTQDVFSDIPLVTDYPLEKTFYLIRNQNGKSIDVARGFSSSGYSILLANSISKMMQKTAKIIHKPIILSLQDGYSLGFTPSGETFTPRGDEAIVYEGSLDNGLKITILSGEEEAGQITAFIKKLWTKLIDRISSNLLISSLVSLGIALILLQRISTKIVKPITLLAKASEEIEGGKYDNLDLPEVEKRKDEVATLVHSFRQMAASLHEREKIRAVLNKVVSKEIAEQILKSKIEWGGEERVITILFSDIRGFTHLSENFDPAALIEMLNDYMTEMCTIIDETKGVVDKFVGDEIMALYGAPVALDDHAVKAVEAALLMRERLKEWNEKQKDKGLPSFEVGMGIHTGLVFSGNMGAKNRQNYTVVGANVNLASRLCSIAKPMQILISEQTYQSPKIAKKFQIHKLDPVLVKGIDQPIPVFEVLSALV